MVKINPSSSKQNQHHFRLRKRKETNKTIHINIHSINITNTNTNKSLNKFPNFNSTSTDSKQNNPSNTTKIIPSSFHRRKTLLQIQGFNGIQINDTRANCMDYQNRKKKKKKRNICKRPPCIIFSILTVLAIILSVLMIILTIFFLRPKEPDKSTISISSYTSTSTSSTSTTTTTTSVTTKTTSVTTTTTSVTTKTTSVTTTTTSVTTKTTSVTTTTTSVTTKTTSVTTTTTTSYIDPALPISCYAILNASSFYLSAGTPTQQADGLLGRPNITNGTYYNAGAYAPQWIQLELPSLYNITSIAFLVIQSSAAITQHNLYAGSNQASLQLVTNLTGTTYTGLWLNTTYNPILTNVKFIKLISVSSPSWIAWQKFVVYSI